MIDLASRIILPGSHWSRIVMIGSGLCYRSLIGTSMWLRVSNCEMTLFSTVDTPSVCWILSCSLCGEWPLHTMIPEVGILEVVVARGELPLRSL
jgi:hypothetical protein